MRRFLILAAGCTVLATAAWAQSPPTTPTPATPNPQQNAAPSDHPSRMAQNDDEGDEGWRGRGWGHHGGWDRGGGRWGRHGGWRERHHDMMGEGSEMMRSGGRSAFFAFRSGRSGFMVRCASGEPMKACVDATMTLLDKVQSMHRTESGTSPNAASKPGAGASPGAGTNPGAGAR